jgi:hypothetical protein
MNDDLPKSRSRSFVLAACFFLIPMLLAFSYPISFWQGNDYEPLGLANALNMAYRLADLRLYPAVGMSNHPGVPFYFMSWLALAFAGYPVATGGLKFFYTVIDHVQQYQRIAIFLAAFAGAAGVYIFARTTKALVPVGVTVVGLLLWLASTPASIATFMSPSNESFAIVLNALFLSALALLAYNKNITLGGVVFAGCVSAVAYLNKLSYVYIPAALAFAIFVKHALPGTDRIRGARLFALFVCAFGATVLATAFFIIGWSEFRSVLAFHKGVILGSGLYGTGSQTVVSTDELRSATQAVPADRAYAVPIALVAGLGLVIAGATSILKKPQQNMSAGMMSAATGVAALLSALFVMKHYGLHYTAGVSATLPACVVSYYLLARSWDYKVGIAQATIATIAILLMAYPLIGEVKRGLDGRVESTRLAEMDLKEITALTMGRKLIVDFAYRVPFSQYGEGFLVQYAGVQPLTDEYVKDRHGVTNSLTEALVTEHVGAYVIDKNYFRNAEAVKQAPNVDLLGPKPVQFKEGDKLIELRTVFLLIRN